MLKAQLDANLEALHDYVDHRLVPRLAESKLRHREMSSAMKPGAVLASVQQTVYFVERSPQASTFELVLTTSKYPEKKHISRVVVGLRAASPGVTDLYLLDDIREARSKGFLTEDQVLLSDRMRKLILLIAVIVILLGLPFFFWVYVVAAIVTVVLGPFLYMVERARRRARLSKVADTFGRDFELRDRVFV